MTIMEQTKQDRRCDIPLAIKEFYAMEALSALAKPEPFRHSHAKWRTDFEELRAQFNEKLADIIFDYTTLAVAGEMRHGCSQASRLVPGFYDDSIYRSSVYLRCVKYSANSILTAGVKLFDESVKWKRSYGGTKWQTIARAGLYRGRLPDSLFIDHCVDLTHNGSIYFDKDTTIVHPLQGRDLEHYIRFLDLKRECASERLLESACSSTVCRLISRAAVLGIIKIPYIDGVFADASYDFNEANILAYQSIRWGEDELECRLEESGGYDSGDCDCRDENRYWRAA